MTTAPDEPLRLPSAPAEPVRPGFPLLSSLAPVLGAGLLWAVTGSTAMLWFALLGPVLALAGLLDGRRGSRRAARRERAAHAQRLAAIRAEVAARHDRERAALWVRHPDVAAHAARPEEIWRPVPERVRSLVVGRGEATSAVRVEGGDGGDAVRALRAAARVLARAPVTVPLDEGVAVVGPPVLARAVARGLLLQACLNLPPGELRVITADDGWAAVLPHRRSTGRRLLRLSEPGERSERDDGVVIAVVAEGDPPPPRCGVVLSLVGPARARVDHGDVSREVEIEPVSRDRARELAAILADRARALRGAADQPAPPLAQLLVAAPRPRPGGLPAVVGTRAGEPVVIDLIADGPHAVVIGVTGSGKSELLISWVVALAAVHTPQQVSFLLVDFKGGRAFDPLARLPHVTGVLTDLDETAAVRAIESLRAELRHRERVLAAAAVRDVEEAGGTLSRLIVVVDEYAALVASHPALHELFGDIAARGRALGVHLVLASQRAAGAFREAVLANAPLRLALRVTDASDSRAVIGTDEAAALSGRVEDRGVCLVRRPVDAAARALRVSRCAPADIEGLETISHPPARRPWLEPLPAVIGLREVERRPGELILGVTDEPEHQRQRPLALPADEPGLVVLGASGSGRTSALRALARQAGAVLTIPADPERGWDATEAAEGVARGALVVADDLDLLLARLGPDHGAVVRERIERLAREARGRGVQVVVSAQRPGGAVARIVEAIPRRLLLSHASRSDHLAAGGAPGDPARLPPGRGRCDGILVQGLWTEPDGEGAAAEATAAQRPWRPSRLPVALVAPAGARTRSTIESWAAEGREVVTVDDPSAVPAPGRVLWGTPEAWLGQWRLLARARAEGHLVIDAACAAEYRAITGSPEVPPFALPQAGRAWLRAGDGAVARILLPS
ncbi:FtsK/SpoIIIE domain-containing protein [Microbacterium sp. T2.11-28]|uniref:FtsK/SpoIIIE domain-containing protein n=1 Tax=Microbacterium sp. T2.11-28 TaxID=3041169 RepID=UPI0025420246|nr:FtsK/SpoIIIE domain-containing protein [Microbacterium sp. T2.11-28]